MKSMLIKGAIIVMALIFATANVHAMRCGNELILEGDNVGKLLSACGEPTSRYGSTFAYINYNGWDYYIHIRENGTIDRVSI